MGHLSRSCDLRLTTLQSLNKATKFAPPHCLNFDCRPALKSGRCTASTSSIPEVHVTIQNITPDGSSLTSSVASSAVSSSSSAIPLHRAATPPSNPSWPASALSQVCLQVLGSRLNRALSYLHFPGVHQLPPFRGRISFLPFRQ